MSDTNTIASDAEDTRERIAATIDELQDRLDPRRIVGDAVGSVRNTGTDLLDQGMALVKGHPIALAAGVLAVGIVALGRDRLSKATVNVGDGETYSDYDDDYAPHGATEAAGQRFTLLRGEAGDRIGDNPLISVLVGLAAGALLGALFPETERERQLFSASSERIRAAAVAAARTAKDELATAKNKVGDVTTHARGAVNSVVGAAKNEFAG
jgi:ElaB/YqjD/DUF883 family membrane-anchored ribosome-binding protein